MVDDSPDRRARPDRRGDPQPAVADELLAAIEGGEIEILFQPQFAAADNALVGAEALARWRHPRLGLMGGEALFALADHAGLVAQLSGHVIRTALAAAAQWPERLRLSLNVTAADLAAPDFAEIVYGALAETGFGPGRLTLEITEQSLVAELDRSAERLQPLADRAIHIALDDFGAGFCNFRYLKRLPLQCLKLDRSMIEGIDEDERDLAVLRGILAMARALGLEVIAEGVEREEQRAAIAREGCASWQGFLGAEPIRAAEFLELASR